MRKGLVVHVSDSFWFICGSFPRLLQKFGFFQRWLSTCPSVLRHVPWRPYLLPFLLLGTPAVSRLGKDLSLLKSKCWWEERSVAGLIGFQSCLGRGPLSPWWIVSETPSSVAFFYAGVQGLLWQLVDCDFVKLIRKVDHSSDEMFWGNPDGSRGQRNELRPQQVTHRPLGRRCHHYWCDALDPVHEAAPTPYQRATRRLPINSYPMMKHLLESLPIVKLFRLVGGTGLYAGLEFWWIFSHDSSRWNCPLNEFIHSFNPNSTAVCQVLFWVLKCRGELGKYRLISLEDLIILGGWEWIGEAK